MERDKEAELREIEEIEEAEKAPPRGDICPHCCQYTGTFPYFMVDPIRGWVECTACGVIFSPKSFRDKKLERANAKITQPPKLIIPA